MQDAVDEVLSNAKKRGINLDLLITDGRWHTFKWNHHDKGKKGAYRAILTPIGVDAVFKYFKDSSKNFSVQSFGKKQLTQEELADHQLKMEQHRKRLELQDKIRWDTAAIESEARWNLGKEDPDHLYLKNKGLKSAHGTRSYLGSLMIPLRDETGKLWGVENVGADGIKRGMKGMRKEGLFHMIGTPDKEIWITEGFATAATIYETFGACSVCAFGANNMPSVAEVIKRAYPNIKITIGGDNDKEGIKQSKRAAKRINAKYVTPKFNSPHPDFTDFNDLKQMEGGESLNFQLEHAEENERDENSVELDWISDWMEENSTKFEYSGVITHNDESLSIPEIYALIFVEAKKEGVKLSERIIKAFISLWIKKSRSVIWDETIKNITAYDPSGVDELKKFLFSLTGLINDEDLSVLLHFIWQVKRKANNLPVDHHMMPVFIGGSGSGKSRAIINLLSPIAPLWATNTLDACSDERKAPFFRDYLVGNMDEMGKAKYTELAHLKHTVSASFLTYRPLFTNETCAVPNRCTLIGSSNEDLDELIKDSTSIRRFFAIKTLNKPELEKNWDIINSINYVKLWHSVDHTKASPILEFMGAVAERQEEMRFKSSVERWVEDVGLIKSEDGRLTTKELYENYSAFCEEQNEKFPKNSVFFGRELSKLGFDGGRTSKIRFWKALYS